MARLTPAEIEALRLKTFGGSAPAEPTPVPVKKARLSPEEIEALRLKTFSPGAVAPLSEETRFESTRKGESIKEAQAKAKAEQAADELRRASMLEQKMEEPLTFDQELARLKADALVQEVSPPIYAGGWNPATFTPLGMNVTTRPQDIAVPRSDPGSLFDALAPQVRGGQVASAIDARKVGEVFDEAAFRDSISKLSPAEQAMQLDAFAAFKAGFKKIRELNPIETGVTDQEIIADLQRQIKAYESGDVPTFTQDPATQLKASGSDVSRAFQKQTTTGTVPVYEPGVIAFVETLKTKRLSDTKASEIEKEITRLKEQGVPVFKTVNPPAGSKGGEPYEVQTGVRPATESDFETARRIVGARVDKEMAVPFFERGDRDEILKKLEENATGGTLFEKKYPTGATVESALSHGLRTVFAVPNYLAGESMELVTPAGTTEKERLTRPALYRDSSAGIYNVAQARGFMGEVEDMWRYSPDPWVRDHVYLGQAGGFALDMLSPEAALVSGGASALRAGTGVLRASSMAERGLGRGLADAGVTALREGGSEALKSIGMKSLGVKLSPGDLRLKSAASLALDVRAVDAYQDAIKGGLAHDEALEVAKIAAPKARAVEAIAKAGDSFDAPAHLARMEKEFDEFQKVSRAADEALAAGGDAEALAKVDLQALKPYIAAAAKRDPGLTAKLEALAKSSTEPGRGTSKLSTLLSSVSDQERFYDTIKDAAAFDASFKAVDRAVGSLEPGKAVLAVTPRTMATEKGAGQIVAVLQNSPEGKLLTEIVHPGGVPEGGAKKWFGLALDQGRTVPVRVVVDGTEQVRNGYKLSPEQARGLTSVLRQELDAGTLSKTDFLQAKSEVALGGISTESMRKLRYSLADSIADRIRVGEKVAPESFPVRALADKSKSVEYGTSTNMVLHKVRSWGAKLSQAMRSDTEARLLRLLDPEQIEAIRVAKGRMSEIDKLFKRDLESLADPAMREGYGLSAEPTLTEKVAAVVLGRAPSLASKKSTLYNYALSTIFGTDNLSASRFFKGFEYEGLEEIFNAAGQEKIAEIIAKYADLIDSPADAVNLLPKMSDEIYALKTAKDAAGKSLLKEKYLGEGVEIFKAVDPEESLVGTYARTQGDRIFKETFEKVLANDPLATGSFRDLIAYGIPDYEDTFRAAVVHQMAGGPPIQNVADLIEATKHIAGSAETIALLQSGRNIDDVLSDVNAMAAAVGRRFEGGVSAESYATDMAKLASGEIPFEQLAPGKNPFSLRKALIQELGEGGKYGELQVELGKLAERAARGSTSAANVSKHVQALLDTANSFFYNAILSYNPRFHTRNLIGAPAIVHMTTGIGLTPRDLIDGARIVNFDPRAVPQWAGGTARADLARDVVVTDRLGNQYTAGDLYQAAVESGILKSQVSTVIDARFLDEAAKLGVGSRWGAKAGGVPKNILGLPSHIAQMEDNIWRLATISHAIKGGSTLDEALKLGRRSLFDFGSATEFERKYVGGKILFYNYFRNSVIQGLSSLLNDPQRVLKQYRLVTDLSKMTVGDETWDDLRFYSPADNSIAAGVTSIVTGYKKKAGRESQLTVLPGLPYYDAAYITTGLLYQPLDLLMGPAHPVTGKRNYMSGLVASKLASIPALGVGVLVGAAVDEDIKTAKNQISPTHVAAADAIGMLPGLTEMWDAKVRDALPGENSYDGKVYELTNDAFESYKKSVKFGLDVPGGGRFVGDMAKFVAGYRLSGPSARGPLENIGVVSTMGQGSAEIAQAKAEELAAQRLKMVADEKLKKIGVERKAPRNDAP